MMGGEEGERIWREELISADTGPVRSSESA
jgi:hypothetical protein